MASLHSPKNPFRAEIHFDEAVKGLGSVVSFTAETIESVKHLCADQCPSEPATIYIWKNMKTFPEFDWQIVEKYRR